MNKEKRMLAIIDLAILFYLLILSFILLLKALSAACRL
jgi:hypothetical protein